MNDFQLFADKYTSTDFGRVKYDWNGKYGSEFHDNNYDFRMKLCEFLVPQIDKTKIELIRDLFVETAKSSAGTFSIYSNIHIYAQELLRRDWKKYLGDYMQAGSYGMDSYLATSRIEIGKELSHQISDYLTERISTTSDDNEKKISSLYLKRFQWLANK